VQLRILENNLTFMIVVDFGTYMGKILHDHETPQRAVPAGHHALGCPGLTKRLRVGYDPVVQHRQGR
jgi:hypothetical protein